MKITNCICCKSTKLKLILDLGDQPWCNNFLTLDQIGKEEYYPLQLMKCEECAFLQLSYFVPKEKMFSKHDYLSGTTTTLTKHFKQIAEDLTDFIEVSKDGLIVDIGGNDGTNLLQYKELGYNNLLNIESAEKQVEVSRSNFIQTHKEFFNERYVFEYFKYGGKAKIINASGVFFHLEEIHSVLRGIKKLLHEDGILCIQFMYVVDMIKNLSFDMIYHEHLFYYTLQTLENLIKQYDLEIVHCYHSDIHSGSMITYIKHSSPRNNKTDNYWENILLERRFLEENSIEDFAEKVKQNKNKLKLRLELIKEEEPNARIYALGAPAKGNTLMNYFDLKGIIKKVHEINELKIDKYTPHTHIKIELECMCDPPNYYLVLAHNFFNEIVENNKEMKEKGIKFILPFPNIKIV